MRPTWRSERKIAAGRHLTDVAGTTAIVRQAIARPSPSTISDPTPAVPPDGAANALRTRTAATGGAARLSFGWSDGLCFTGLLFSAFFGLAFAMMRVDGLDGLVERGTTVVALGARYVEVGMGRAAARGAAGARAGFGLGGAGSGAGTAGLGTVVGGASSPRAFVALMRPKPTATGASITATAKVRVRPDKLPSSLEARRRSDCKLRSGRPTPRLDWIGWHRKAST